MTEWDIRKLRVLRTLRDRGYGDRRGAGPVDDALRGVAAAVRSRPAARRALLEAHGRRVRLTDAAHLVLRHAEAVFAQLRAGRRGTGRARAGRRRHGRIGAFSTAVPALVVPAVRALRAARPGLEVRVREAEAAEAYGLLAAGDVDVALSLAARAPTARDPRFTRVPLLADPLDVALPQDHPATAAPELRLADLAEEPWIFGGSGPWSEITLTACEAAGLRARPGPLGGGLAGDPGDGGRGHGRGLIPRMAATAGTGAPWSAPSPRTHPAATCSRRSAAARRRARRSPAY